MINNKIGNAGDIIDIEQWSGKIGGIVAGNGDDVGILPVEGCAVRLLPVHFYFRVGVDGLFTDFPDRAVDFLRRAAYQR